MSAIVLLPLGGADRALVMGLRPPLMETFRTPVTVYEANVDIEQYHDRQRVQYSSTQILLNIRRHVPPIPQGRGEVGKILAIAAEDLFIPILTYVFGEAQLGGEAAVVSYHRLQNEMYGLPPDHSLLTRRLLKESLHELGHAYGLVHCLSQDCVMRSSTHVEDIDLKGHTFCRLCAEELQSRL